MDAVTARAGDQSLNQYGSGAGLPELVQALQHKVATENGISQVIHMIILHLLYIVQVSCLPTVS